MTDAQAIPPPRQRAYRWGGDGSTKFLQAVGLLMDLGEPLAQDAYCEAHAEQIERAFSEQFEVKKLTTPRALGRPCINYFLNRNSKCQCGPRSWCKPPGQDHCSIWARDGVPAYYVYQPYGMDGEEIAALVEFCAEKKLHFKINAWHSWHYPARTLSVVIYTEQERLWKLRPKP